MTTELTQPTPVRSREILQAGTMLGFTVLTLVVGAFVPVLYTIVIGLLIAASIMIKRAQAPLAKGLFLGSVIIASIGILIMIGLTTAVSMA